MNLCRKLFNFVQIHFHKRKFTIYFNSQFQKNVLESDCPKNKPLEHKLIAFDPNVSTYTQETPVGEKKDITCPLPDSYNPHYVEAVWYDWWEKLEFFKPNESKDDRFVMCIPPPNITGQLHLGHALTVAIQDALVRWHRMNNRQVLWIPGCDHAGIATQTIVEKKIWKDSKRSRHNIGKGEFLNEIWQWKKTKIDEIVNQLRKLGASLDWDRFLFTLDTNHSEAVTEAFIKLHDENLIYRSNQIINWSCHLQSTISDIEVEYISLNGPTLLDVPDYNKKIEFGTLLSFAYPLVNGGEIVVSTTRIESMLGDVAIAVNPEDERYFNFHSKSVRHPFIDRELPIICDLSVDKQFGTGAVKITPAHSSDDYNIALRHNLTPISVINKDGKLNNNCGQFQGLKRFDAKDIIVQLLQEKGLFRDKKSHNMNLPLCSRSGDVIEYLLLPQWFLNCREMADSAIKAVKNKQLILIPEYTEKLWLHWLQNIKDWCLSRQLWWGHRIPAYKVTSENAEVQTVLSGLGFEVWISGCNEQEALEKVTSKLNINPSKVILQQDEDVLDTWFSSALFPLTILGWPKNNSYFQKYYPLNLMETGNDILFFWVARMVMLGNKLTGRLPFQQVLCHSLIKDAHGQKMSKSKGNVVDPGDIINGISFKDLKNKLLTDNILSNTGEIVKTLLKDFPNGIPECGTDALRFALCSHDIKQVDLRLDINLVYHFRTFCNKIWQASKFVFNNILNNENFSLLPLDEVLNNMSILDYWIFYNLNTMIEICESRFKTYDFDEAVFALHKFWYFKFCDTYLECVKVVLRVDNPEVQNVALNVLIICLDKFYRCLCPFMPFITEELYQRLSHITNKNTSICVTSYPSPTKLPKFNNEMNDNIEFTLEVAKEIRKIITMFKVGKFHPKTYICCDDYNDRAKLEKCSVVIFGLSRSKEIEFVSDSNEIPNDYFKKKIRNVSIYVKLKDYINTNHEVSNFQKHLSKLESKLLQVESQLDTPDISSKSISSLQLKKYDVMKDIKDYSDALIFLQNNSS